MRFVSFNANGIRARQHQLQAIVDTHNPDVLALQETKVADEQFPHEDIQALGFADVQIFGQKGHYGVALLSKIEPRDVSLGIPWCDAEQQRRFIAATYPTAGGPVTVLNGYFPQGESRDHPTKFPDKARFYEDVGRYLRECCSPADAVIVAGDMNVAPADEDISIGPDNVKRWLRTGKTSFLPEERDWLEALQNWGLADSYAVYQDGRRRLHSWFDYRSRGFERDPKRGLRIDLILASTAIMNGLQDCGVDHDIRNLTKPSDHCPVWCNFSL